MKLNTISHNVETVSCHTINKDGILITSCSSWERTLLVSNEERCRQTTVTYSTHAQTVTHSSKKVNKQASK